MSDEWRSTSACDLGRGIAAGDIDPQALTETFLSAIDAHPLAGRIFIAMDAERARAEAEAAAQRAKAGARRHLLDGVPTSWKDLYDTAGDVTGAGSAMTAEDAPAAEDAEALKRAVRVGMVTLGKTHMTEMAFSGLGVNPVTETSPNVFGTEEEGGDWAPGGSSSGAGASVAFGLAPAGIGSDTGGSVRIPSAWQGLVGLKTTLGLIPVDGSSALAAGFDTVGPLCRTVEDAAAITAVMADIPMPDLAGASLKGARILVDEATMLDGAEDAPAAAFADGLARLKAAGAEVTVADIPEFADALDVAGPLITAEAWAEWGERIEAKGDRMFHQIRDRTTPGRDVSAAQYLRAWKQLMAVRRAYAARVAGFDAVAAPTAPILPPSAARLLADDEYYQRINLMALRNTRIGNLLGLSSLTLPTGAPGCGFMLFGKPFGEGALCRLGAAAEAQAGLAMA